MIGIGLIGYGYWGPNLARVFSALPACRIVGICDLREDRRGRAAQSYRDSVVTSDYKQLLDSPEVQLILIATPVQFHYPLAKKSILAGKDVLVEKPLARTSAEAEEIIRIARESRRIVAVDHTFLYSGAVETMKGILDSGELGEIRYIDCVRVNLGIFQHDVNVIYDLAPHDLSIIDYLIRRDPVTVQAMGIRHENHNVEHLAYMHLEYEDDLIAHFHLNWLAPVKIRRTLIGGTKKMIVYDDLEQSEKIKVYDKGIVIRSDDQDSLNKVRIDYRTGDMVAPRLESREPLEAEAEHILSCVRNRTRPRADGEAGFRVIRILEAAQRSIQSGGAPVSLESE